MQWDIREYKRELRQKYKEIRSAMTPEERQQADDGIFLRVTALPAVQEAEELLCYVSLDLEVSTFRLLRWALNQGKQVAVPRCIPGTPLMEFYRIRSMEDLSAGAFGVLEPQPDPKRLVTEFAERSVCVVPGLCFDLYGYRLGYGKGYYDRYLSAYSGKKLGICYENCICSSLIRGRFDLSMDLLVTERELKQLRRPDFSQP